MFFRTNPMFKKRKIGQDGSEMKDISPLFPFKHKELLQTALPMGGIGAGCICLNGYGGLQDFSIRNRPHTTALLERRMPTPDAGFALLRVAGSADSTRLVEGPLPEGKIYDQGIWSEGQDIRRAGHEGLPRFRRCRFESGYPFGKVALSDPKMPLTVEVVGWSPFVPLDDVASGLPAAILEYTLRNPTRKAVDFEFSYHLSHLAVGASGDQGTRNAVLPGKGVLFSNTEPAGATSQGSASLTVIGQRPAIKAMWLRGGWFDAISALWREVAEGKFVPNDGKGGAGRGGRNGGSVLVRGRLAPGKEITVPVAITWHYPNCDLAFYHWGQAHPPGHVQQENVPAWRPFYTSQWADAGEVAAYLHRHYSGLRERTVGFQRALFSSDLPPEVLDAVSANLAILKSPTLLRQENGNLWGWEGCNPGWGSCFGSCTHVWNYAQSLCHLFPQLERTLREQELKRSMDERGHVTFRSALPDGAVPHDFHSAADGQLGGIMKVYRDWQICGDAEWLREMYPLAKRSLDYCIGAWDPERRGGLFEPHHNTYDIEFWGPDGMCGSVYLGALSALAAMAAALGKEAEAAVYAELAGRAARFLEEELFNGDYFEQKVTYAGLRDTSFLELIRKDNSNPGTDAETLKLLRSEGPKYQYGQGCLSDGVIGAWMAKIYGIATPLDRTKVRRNLRAIHRHNFRRSLAEHANCQRMSYAVGDEPGLLLCSWPRGGKPTLPFIYSDEVWTGIEYQVASHLIAEGLVQPGLEIVRAVRSRYDGRVRNPWNEFECGNYYARAMASYALLGAYAGFRYSAVEQTLWLDPKTAKRPFSCFFSTASGYGTVSLERNSLTIELLEGTLACRRIVLGEGAQGVELPVDLSIKAGKVAKISLSPKVKR